MTTITSTTGMPDPSELTQPQPQPQQVGLQVADLQALLQSVDLAAQRGAYRGNELTQVGQPFDRVLQFLQAVLPPPASEPAVAPTPQPAPEPQTPTMTPVSTAPMAPPFAPKIGG